MRREASNLAEPLSEFDRLPPHDVEAEMCLIASAVLGGPGMWQECRRLVGRGDFYQADHQAIWEVLDALYARGDNVDAILLRAELLKRGVWEEVGGRAYLAQILDTVPSAAHGAQYADRVAETSKLRQLIGISNDLLRACYSPTRSDDRAAELLRAAMTRLAQAAQERGREQAQRLDEIIAEVRAQMDAGGQPLIPLGFRDLDEMTGGGGLGEMILIGARPSMGKSTLLKQMTLRTALSGVPAALLSAEESKAKIGRNILAAEARVDNHKIRRGRDLSERDWQEIDAATGKLAGVEMYVRDGLRRLDDLAAEASLLVAKRGVRLIAVDYLQRINAGGRDAYERAGAASVGLSDLFKDLGVAGIVAVQLNRGVESREDKRPNMADLRDSGQLEQDADGILLLHREDYYHPEAGYQPTGVAELIVAKWRDGVRGKTINLQSNLRFQTFEDYDDCPV
jgi:replicative DNA helicase